MPSHLDILMGRSYPVEQSSCFAVTNLASVVATLQDPEYWHFGAIPEDTKVQKRERKK